MSGDLIIPGIAGADLSGELGYALQIDATGWTTTPGSGTFAGVLAEPAEAGAGARILVVVFGVALLRCGGAIAIGDRLTLSGSKKPTSSTANTDLIIGRALTATTLADQYLYALINAIPTRKA